MGLGRLNIIHLVYMDNISNKINEIYEKRGYLDRYGLDIFITVFLIFTLTSVSNYLNIKNNAQPIINDWENQKCNPKIMPFAGLINKPPDMTAMEFTTQNFTSCMQHTISELGKDALEPLNDAANLSIGTFSGLGEITSMLTGFLNNIRNIIQEVFSYFTNIINGILVPINRFTVGIQTWGNQVSAIMLVLGNFLVGLMLQAQTILRLISSASWTILAIIMGALLTLLWALFPIGWPIAAAVTVMGVAITSTLTVFDIMLKNVVDTLPPESGSCFDGKTKIKMNDGSTKSIKNIKPGEKLANGAYITATMKFSSENVPMYNLNNIIVSGSHKLLLDNRLIKVCEYGEAVKLEDYREQFIYCISTSDKLIYIDDLLFSDFDELDKADFTELASKIKEAYNININSAEDIHKNIEGGFSENTEIELENGNVVCINKISINDVLKQGERVLGLVKINHTTTQCKLFKINNKEIVGGPNLQICDSDLGMVNTLDILGHNVDNNKNLYHLITNKNYFYINSVRFADYNSVLEMFIAKDRKKLLSKL